MDRFLFRKLLFNDSDEGEIIEVVMETSQHKRRRYI